MFDLERLQPDGYPALARFCAYLAGDLRATMRMYGAVGRHLVKCLSLVMVVWIVLAIVIAAVEQRFGIRDLNATIAGIRFQIDGFTISLIASCVAVFLMMALLFFSSRFLYRTKMKRAILRRKFTESFIPVVLDGSLTRADLLRVLSTGDVIPHHEAPAALTITP